MSNFTFSATAQCDRCGNYLSSSTEECDECSEEDLTRYHFEHISTGEIETVWSINPIRAWHDVMEKVDEPLPWKCVETGAMTLHMKQMGVDIREIWREAHDVDE